MRSYEIKKIGPGSVFKFFFIVGVVFSLLTVIILLIVGSSLKKMGLEGVFCAGCGLLQMGAAVVGVIMASLAYGLVAGLIGAVGALIYNGFAAVVGGVVIKLGDKDFWAGQ